jgi:hypothetical protein
MNKMELLSLFEKVTKTGKDNQFQVICPAHADKTASLAIKINSDGRVLLHCFAGCGIENICGSLGISIDDLLPEKIDVLKPMGKIYNPYAVLKSLRDEVLLVLIAANELADGKELNEHDRERLLVSVNRLRDAYDYARR